MCAYLDDARVRLCRLPWLFAHRQIKKYRNERFVDLSCTGHKLVVRHNVKLVFFDWDQVGTDDKVCFQHPACGAHWMGASSTRRVRPRL